MEPRTDNRILHVGFDIVPPKNQIAAPDVWDNQVVPPVSLPPGVTYCAGRWSVSAEVKRANNRGPHAESDSSVPDCIRKENGSCGNVANQGDRGSNFYDTPEQSDIGGDYPSSGRHYNVDTFMSTACVVDAAMWDAVEDEERPRVEGDIYSSVV